MSRVSEIYKGWKNYVFANPDVEERAKERLEICVKCDAEALEHERRTGEVSCCSCHNLPMADCAWLTQRGEK